MATPLFGTLFLLWLGFAALVSQTLFVRELLNLFSGNEFSLGITLATWLIFTGIGSACGDWLSRSRYLTVITVFALLLLALLLPLFPIAVLSYRSLAHIPPELNLTPLQMSVATLLLQSLPAFLFGLLFPAGYAIYCSDGGIKGGAGGICAHLSNNALDFPPPFQGEGRGGDGVDCVVSASYQKQPHPHPNLPLEGEGTKSPNLAHIGAGGRVYAIESIGALLGGLAACYLILPLKSPINTLVCTPLPGICILLLYLPQVPLKKIRRAGLSILLLTSAISLLGAAAKGALNELEERMLAKAYPYAKVLYNASSRYQKLTLLSMGGQYTLMAGGEPLLSTPHPDDGSSEATVLISMTAVEGAKSAIVIGGLGKFPRLVGLFPGVSRIECIESDPALFDVAGMIPNAGEYLGVGDPRIHLIKMDARRFISESSHRYDVVLISMPPPVTLSGNRFYTVDFFRAAARILNSGGIFVIELPGSDTYLTPKSAGMLASVKSAIAEAFPFTMAIPGERTLLLASGSPLKNRVGAGSISARLSSSGIVPRFVTGDYLNDRLSAARLNWLQNEMDRSEVATNRDDFPAAAALALAAKMEEQGYTGKWNIWSLPHWSILPLGTFLLILTYLPGFALPGNRRALWLGAMASTGFSAMALQVILMLAYQSRTGVIYQGVALFTAIFMSGTAVGVWLSGHFESSKSPESISLSVEGAFASLASLLSLLFYSGNSELFGLLLPIGCMLTGLLTGAEFHAVSRVMGDGDKIGERPGAVYAADLFGAALGGLLCGMLMIPLTGFGVTCAILAAVKGVQFFMLFRLHGVKGGL